MTSVSKPKDETRDASQFLSRIGYAVLALSAPTGVVLHPLAIFILFPVGIVLICLAALIDPPPNAGDRLVGALTTPAVLLGLAGLAWATLSMFWTPFPIAAGQQYEAIGKLVRRLQFLGDLPPSVSVPQNSLEYSGAVAEGVKHFQLRHGLDASGKLGPQTITELNRPMSDRVEQLRLMLERFRWMPHSFAQPPIIVNIPEFVLRAYDSSLHPTLIMPVVVGRAMRTQTPVLEEEMKYLIFWPYWNVPPSILRAEIVPKITKDPEYLQKNNFEVTTYSGEVVTDSVVSEEVLAQLRAGQLMVRQKPGQKNALGLIKFVFPNADNIYLHSTPSQALFDESRRDFSHGCIRVEDPRALATWVLRNNPGWTRERVEAAFQAQKQEQVNLAHEIPVLILYGTAIANEDGQVYFFEDIYGFDKALTKLLDQAYASKNGVAGRLFSYSLL